MTWRVGLSEVPLHHQDRNLIDLQLGLFGVFDGVGQFPRSGEAAALAAETIGEACRSAVGSSAIEALLAGCERAENLIRERSLGATTATVAWCLGADVSYVSVGDSRLYCQPERSAQMAQITTDEGEGRILFNALGQGPSRQGGPVAPQRGILAIGPGAKLVLVTDGVTGDYPPDLLSEQDLGSGLSDDDPQVAAERLTRMARKHDDRTALVVFFD